MNELLFPLLQTGLLLLVFYTVSLIIFKLVNKKDKVLGYHLLRILLIFSIVNTISLPCYTVLYILGGGFNELYLISISIGFILTLLFVIKSRSVSFDLTDWVYNKLLKGGQQ